MMAPKGKKSTSKLPSDWRVHMFSDIYSSDEENEMGIDNPNSEPLHSHIQQERASLHIPSLESRSKQPAHSSENGGASLVYNNNRDMHKVNSESALARNGVHGLPWHRRHSSGVGNNGISQQRNKGPRGPTDFQTSVLVHEDPRWRLMPQNVTNRKPNASGAPRAHSVSGASTGHDNHFQSFGGHLDCQLAQSRAESCSSDEELASSKYPSTAQGTNNEHHLMTERHVDLPVSQEPGSLPMKTCGSPPDKNRSTKQLHTNPQTSVAASSSCVEDTSEESSWKSVHSLNMSIEITAEDDLGSSPRQGSRQPFRQLCVQSLGSETGESSLYLPADDTVDVPKVEKKAKGWEKLRSMLRRKSKDTVSQSGQDSETRERTNEDKSKKTKKRSALRGKPKLAGSDAEAGTDDVYTVAGQVLSLDDATGHQSSESSSFQESSSAENSPPGSGRDTTLPPAPIPLKRRSKDSGPTSSPKTSDPSSFPANPRGRPSSPLMLTSSKTFPTQEVDTDSETSSVTSDSPVFSSESTWDSGDPPEGSSGRKENAEEFLAKMCRGTVEGAGREKEHWVKVDAQPEPHCKTPKVSDRAVKSLTASNTSAMGQDHNEATQAHHKGPYGKLFTAKFVNRLGCKGSLSNVTNVSHVHKGTVLVTELISGKLLHLDSRGRVLKHFEVDPGSEPWCACVTPCGHVAVTVKHPPCVTVWSGNGTLLQEFGCSILQSPTGLACDSQGNFIVADERTHRVAVFTSDGHFLRYLVKSSPVCNNDNDRSKPIEESTTVCDNKPVNNNNKENSSDKQRGSVSSKTKKRVRINLESSEIITVDPNENIVHNETMVTTPQTYEKNGCHNDSEMGGSLNTPEPYAFNLPRYVCVSASGHIVVSNSGSNSIKVFTPEGVYLRTIGSSGSKDGQLKVPYGVCCDQDNNIYVADHYNDRISVFSLEGEFLQHALTVVSGLCRPKSITIRPAHVRKLFVAHGGLRATEILAYCLEPTPRCISFTCDL